MRRLICFVVLAVMPGFGCAFGGSYGGGLGSAEDPFQIWTAEHMYELGLSVNHGDLDNHFLLMADIDLSAYKGDGFQIIGASENAPFIGVFDGNNHVISNFSSDLDSRYYDCAGLFGYVGNVVSGAFGVIGNLKLVNSEVNTEGTGGVLVGSLFMGRIYNCHVTGEVSGKICGGLAGINEGVIINSSADCNVRGGVAGVLIGRNFSAINHCNARGTVTGDASFSYGLSVGGLVGDNGWGYTYGKTVISNCYSSCDVFVENDSYYVQRISAGGLVGRVYGGVYNSFANGTITVNNYSSNLHSIDVGGLAGYCTGMVANSYADCTVMSSSVDFASINSAYAGGLVGYVSGKVEKCYSRSLVLTSVFSYVIEAGGLVGGGNTGDVSNSFWDTEASGLATSRGGEGISTIDMRKQSTFAGWDFVGSAVDGEDDIWRICEGFDYPRLWWEPKMVVRVGGDQYFVNSIPSSVALEAEGLCNVSSGQWRQVSGPSVLLANPEEALATFEPTEWGTYVFELEASGDSDNVTERITVHIEQRYDSGRGTKSDPYVISTGEQMNEIGTHEDDWDKCFVLSRDISLAAYSGEQFNVIGRYADVEYRRSPENVPFCGVFDGRGHKISNFTYQSAEGYGVGIFGYISGEVKGLSLIDANVDCGAGIIAGGLVGIVVDGKIAGCHVGGIVTGDSEIGGLAGINDNGLISYCSSSASVVTNEVLDNFAGGLLSYNDGIVSNCYATGDVFGGEAGGLLSGQGIGMVFDSYATGNVTGNGNWGGGIGGLIGCLWGWESSGIYNCYATGAVFRPRGNEGGLVGSNYDGDAINNCYWDVLTTGSSVMCGLDWGHGGDDSFGKTTEEMMKQGTFVGWDFTVTWSIDEGNDYPKLRGPYPGDFDYDRDVDIFDFGIFADVWGGSQMTEVSVGQGPPYRGDLDGDGFVGIGDLVMFAESWLVDLSLVGYWRLDELSGSAAGDRSAYSRDGLLLNMDGGEWVEGKVRNALEFDGVDDSVEIASYKGIAGGNSRSVCAWIKTFDTSGEIVSWGVAGPGERWNFVTEGSGFLRVEVGGGAIVGSTFVCDNEWHYVAVVLEDDGSPNVNEIRLYVDGVEDVPSLNVSDRVVNTVFGDDFTIGGWVAGGRYFEGLIDEVRIYDRALSAEEIGELSN